MTAVADPNAGRATTRDWLAIAGGMFGCFMAVLDIQITNSSLAPIEGGIGASIDEGSWISTAYLIAEIVAIPLTGWLMTVFGLRRCLAAVTTLFVLFSIGCAQSTSLLDMIIWRAGQGFAGGILIPSALSVVNIRLPPHQQPIGIALFGVGATFAPAVGPTIGGWLTETMSWHYIFYLNVVPGICAVLLHLYAHDPQRVNVAELKNGDWWGIATMATGLSAMTVVLEEGQRWEWFESTLVCELSVIAVVALVFFLIIEFTADNPFINLRLLGRRAIGGSILLSAAVGAVSYGSVFLIPVYLAEIPHYNARQIGEVVMWSGLPQLFVFPLMPLLTKTFSVRTLSATAALIFAASCFANASLTHDVGINELILPQVLRSIAFPIFVIPLLQLATSGMSPRDTADGSSLFNMFRNVGGSIGIAVLATMTQNREQVHYAALAERLSGNSLVVDERIRQLGAISSTGDGGVARLQAILQIAGQIRREATVMAYSDVFMALGIGLLICMLAVFILPKTGPTGGTMTGH